MARSQARDRKRNLISVPATELCRPQNSQAHEDAAAGVFRVSLIVEGADAKRLRERLKSGGRVVAVVIEGGEDDAQTSDRS